LKFEHVVQPWSKLPYSVTVPDDVEGPVTLIGWAATKPAFTVHSARNPFLGNIETQVEKATQPPISLGAPAIVYKHDSNASA